MTTQADGTAERDAALLMLNNLQEGRGARITLGADKAYDTQDFVSTVRNMRVTPHVTQNTSNRRSAIDARTTRHTGYTVLEADTYQRAYGVFQANADVSIC